MKIVEYGWNQLLVTDGFSSNGYPISGDATVFFSGKGSSRVTVSDQGVEQMGDSVLENWIKESRACGELGFDQKLFGVAAVLYTIIDGRALIFVQRERIDKPIVDRKAGDFSILAESGFETESEERILSRALREEMGWHNGLVQLSPVPLGTYAYPVANKYGEVKTHVLVKLFSGYVSPGIIRDVPIRAIDGETDMPMWTEPNILLGGLAARRGVLGMVADWRFQQDKLFGARSNGSFIKEVSSARHDMQLNILYVRSNVSSGSVWV